VTRTSRPDRLIGAGVARLARARFRGAGQGIVEYGLILSLSAALAVVLLVFFGGTLSAVLNAVGDAIDAAS
jgi:Flp pilus assembly pilin Flp